MSIFAQSFRWLNVKRRALYGEYTFVGFVGGEKHKIVIPNLDRAAEFYGFQEAHAANPRARFRCEGADCVNISLRQSGEFYVAEGTADISFFLLGGKSMRFSYREQERWEGYLSR